MAGLVTLSPVVYIESGAELRKMGVMPEVTGLESLAAAFLHYLKFMERRLAAFKDNEKPVPLTWEGFRIFSGVTPEKYKELTSPPEGALLHSLITDCINSQWTEGAAIGLFNSKGLQVAGGLKEKVEVSGKISMEQITGMEIV